MAINITERLLADYPVENLSYANCRTSSMQLAYGLMGNIPNLYSTAAQTFLSFRYLHLQVHLRHRF
jgi:hypothetical protein